MSKKTDTIEIQTSSIASKTTSNSQWKSKCIILAVQELSETRQSPKHDNMVQLTTEQRVVYVLCTKSRSVLCIPMGIHRNEIRS